MQRFQTKEILVLYLHIFIVILWFKSDTGVSMRYLSVKNTRGALHKCMNASSELISTNCCEFSEEPNLRQKK